MNMRSIITFTFITPFPYRYILYSHKFTSSQGIEICHFCSYISSCSGDSMNFYDSFFMKAECPQKSKEVICSWVTINKNLRYLRGMCVYHTSRILYFFVICKILVVLLFCIEYSLSKEVILHRLPLYLLY